MQLAMTTLALLIALPIAQGAALLIAQGAAFALAQDAVSPRDREQARRHLRAGQEALESERYEIADREFSSALALDPSLELAHYGLGQVGMALRRYDRAISSFLLCRDVFHKNESEATTGRLVDERRLDEQIQGLKDFRQAIQTGRVRSVNPTASIRQYDSQIRQLENLRRRSSSASVPTPPYISIAMGSAYFRTGAFADAEREWRDAVAVDPTLGEAHNNLAVVCMLTERYEEAEREIALAEKAGFRVSEGLKKDLKERRKKLNSSAGTRG
jgi:tetratricopeptide (TPR) repeat protein